MITTFVLTTVLHHVDMSCIIETSQRLEYDIDKHNPYWITYGPLYNKFIFTKLYGTVFEKYIRDARTDRYNIMCSIYECDKKNTSSVNYFSNSFGNKSRSSLTIEALFSLGEKIEFHRLLAKIM